MLFLVQLVFVVYFGRLVWYELTILGLFGHNLTTSASVTKLTNTIRRSNRS